MTRRAPGTGRSIALALAWALTAGVLADPPASPLHRAVPAAEGPASGRREPPAGANPGPVADDDVPPGAVETLPPTDPRPFSQLVAAEGRPAAPDEAPSLLAFNTAGARTAIQARKRFYPVYTGVEERDGRPSEVLAIRILLGDGAVVLSSKRLRQGLSGPAAVTAERLRDEKARLGAWIEAEARRPDFGHEYLSYEGPARRQDPEFFIYTTSHRWIARCYGEVVFEVRECIPRGIDLNTLNREVFRYYDHLSLGDRLNPRSVIIRHLLDRDEYVIPSHIPGGDVASVDVRARLPRLPFARSVQPGGRLQRRYVRGGTGKWTWVDALDRGGRVIARLALDPGVPRSGGARSDAALPPEVEADLSRRRIDGRAVTVVR